MDAGLGRKRASYAPDAVAWAVECGELNGAQRSDRVQNRQHLRAVRARITSLPSVHDGPPRDGKVVTRDVEALFRHGGTAPLDLEGPQWQ